MLFWQKRNKSILYDIWDRKSKDIGFLHKFQDFSQAHHCSCRVSHFYLLTKCSNLWWHKSWIFLNSILSATNNREIHSLTYYKILIFIIHIKSYFYIWQKSLKISAFYEFQTAILQTVLEVSAFIKNVIKTEKEKLL